MPVDRRLAEDLARHLTALYADLEYRLAEDLARRLRAGVDQSDWAVAKLAAIGVLRRHVEALLNRLSGQLGDAVEQMLVLAYVRGGEAALSELVRLGSVPEPTRLERLAAFAGLRRVAQLLGDRRRRQADRELAQVRTALPGVDALQALAQAHMTTLRGTHLQVLRWDLDTYRTVVYRTTVDILAGTQTRLSAAQNTLDRLISQGVTGFVDKAGRHWQLASYVEMATRTAAAQAAVQAHVDQLRADGHDLVIVSDAPQECVLCRPWEGRVLSITHDGAGTLERQHATRDGLWVPVRVAGSVRQAIAAGLLHPNCRHTLSLYLPGVTTIPRHTADPQGAAARQRQREIERHIRAWKLREAAALTPDAKARAGVKVRGWQAALRQHLADHSELRRLRHREQVGIAR